MYAVLLSTVAFHIKITTKLKANPKQAQQQKRLCRSKYKILISFFLENITRRTGRLVCSYDATSLFINSYATARLYFLFNIDKTAGLPSTSHNQLLNINNFSMCVHAVIFLESIFN